MDSQPLVAIVLAAGLGKRMRSTLPKVLHPLCGRPLIDHVLAALAAAGVEKTYVIVGHGAEQVRAHIADHWGEHGGPKEGAEAAGTRKTQVECIEQAERLGTGHAVLQAAPQLAEFHGDVLITCGDAPLITAETFRALVAWRHEHRGAGVVLSAIVPNPTGYGRVVRRDKETVQRIVEEKDCTDIQRKIDEVNVATYCFDARLLFEALREVKNDNKQGEYYLTDVIEILVHHGGKTIGGVTLNDWTEMVGINSREQLAEAAGHLGRRTLRRIMDEGVTVIDPGTTHIEFGVTIGPESIIEPFTILRGASVIGANCRIGPYSELINARIGDGATVRHSVVENAEVAAGETVWPFTHVTKQG